MAFALLEDVTYGFNEKNSLCSWHRVTTFRDSEGTESLGRPQGQRPAVRNDFTKALMPTKITDMSKIRFMITPPFQFSKPRHKTA